MTQHGQCDWCGRGMAINRTGRPRRYCRRSHRQRAFEARRLAARMGLESGEALVSASGVRDLNDRIYFLEAALDDVERDLRRNPDDHRHAFRHLYAAASGLRGVSLEPRAVLEGPLDSNA